MDWQIVVIECPYDSWAERNTQEFFGKMGELKLKGYRREYPYGVLPFDTSDFVACHHLFCVKQNGELRPVMAYRNLTYERCLTHRIGFPPLNLMKILGFKDHVKVLEEIIEKNVKIPKQLLYTSSIAVSEDFRGNKELRNLLMATHALYMRDYGITNSVAGGVVRFKMFNILNFIGYEDLSLGGRILPPVPVPFVLDEPTAFYYLSSVGEKCMQLAKSYERIWQDRLTVGDLRMTKIKKAA